LAKNFAIILLVIAIDVLIGIIIVTNYNWFTQEWLIGLGMTIGGIIVAGIISYAKIKRK